MPHISGKRAFLEILKQEGVDVMFGNPGTTELPLMDALAVEDGIRYVLALQEAAVMAMADGYAQASGKLAVVSLHVTPGLGNAMGMLYDAQKAGSPILVTAGQHDQGFNVTEPILWADLPTIARPLVKWSAEVHRLADLPRMVHRAAKTAQAPPSGPVFLSLPADVLKEEGDIDLLGAHPGRARHARRPRGGGGGGGAPRQGRAAGHHGRRRGGAGPRAARAGGARRSAGRAGLCRAHPQHGDRSRRRIRSSRGTVNRVAPYVRKMLDEHDLLFSVGADLFAMSLPSDQEPVPPGFPIIHLDVDPWELGKNFPAKVAILGDPKGTLPDLLEALNAAHGRARPRQGARARRGGEAKAISPPARSCAPRRAARRRSARCSRWR